MSISICPEHLSCVTKTEQNNVSEAVEIEIKSIKRGLN